MRTMLMRSPIRGILRRYRLSLLQLNKSKSIHLLTLSEKKLDYSQALMRLSRDVYCYQAIALLCH